MIQVKIIETECVDSTNEYCKKADKGKDFILIAERQTGGRGTKGRSFSSEKGGIYLTVVRHYTDFPSVQAFKIMINASVAVCKTLERFGIKPVIRWANDILVEGKKICGTLIENRFSEGKILRSVVGIGLNVSNPLPAELSGIAVSVREVAENPPEIAEVKSTLLKCLEEEYTLKDYLGYMPWMGGEVTVKDSSGEFTCTAVTISDDGRLVCYRGKKLLYISSAEVSLRLQ